MAQQPGRHTGRQAASALATGRFTIQLCQMERKAGCLGSKPSNSASSVTVSAGEWFWVIERRWSSLTGHPICLKNSLNRYWRCWRDRDILPKEIISNWKKHLQQKPKFLSTDVYSINYQILYSKASCFSTEKSRWFSWTGTTFGHSVKFPHLWTVVLRWGTLLQATTEESLEFLLSHCIIFTYQPDTGPLPYQENQWLLRSLHCPL